MPKVENFLFIAPARHEVLGNGSKIKKSLAPPLGLSVLAGITPQDIEVSLVDENISPVNFDQRVSLVAITAATHTASRAYEIAKDVIGLNVNSSAFSPFCDG